MLNIIYTDDPITLNYEAHKIVNQFAKSELKQFLFDNNHQNLIDFLLQTNLFADEETFLIRDASFLIIENKANEALVNDIKKMNVDIYLFLEAKTPKFINAVDKNFIVKKIYKFNESQKHQLIDDLLVRAKVKFDSPKTQGNFENIVATDPFLIENEINKLILASENNVISHQAVEDTVNNSSELNIFKLTNYLLVGDKTNLIKLYDNLILSKYQPTELIPIIGNQLLTLKMLKMAYAQNYSANDIESKLAITKYAQMVNKPLISNMPLSQIDGLINEFYLLDYNIKHNAINPYHGLKMLLAK
jgi:DNA polymerase-3 subunit delta